MINGIADEAVRALQEADRQGKKDRGSDRGIIGAMQNGIGLIAVRLCIFLMTAMVMVIGYVVQDKLGELKTEIQRVDQKVDKVDYSLSSFTRDINTQAITDRMDIVQLKDRVRTLEQYGSQTVSARTMRP